MDCLLADALAARSHFNIQTSLCVVYFPLCFYTAGGAVCNLAGWLTFALAHKAKQLIFPAAMIMQTINCFCHRRAHSTKC